jgi:aminoglycoside 3'-phosphotransferase-2
MLQLPAALCSEIRRRVMGYQFRRVHIGRSSSTVFRLTCVGKAPLFVKAAVGDGIPELQAEHARLNWLAGRAPAPSVLAFVIEDDQACLLTTALSGCNAVESHTRHREQVVVALADALRKLHLSPVLDCPFDQSLGAALKLARTLTLAGKVDESDFDEERQGHRVLDLLRQVEDDRPEAEDIVVTHGDPCLPNVISKVASSSAS